MKINRRTSGLSLYESASMLCSRGGANKQLTESAYGDNSQYEYNKITQAIQKLLYEYCFDTRDANTYGFTIEGDDVKFWGTLKEEDSMKFILSKRDKFGLQVRAWKHQGYGSLQTRNKFIFRLNGGNPDVMVCMQFEYKMYTDRTTVTGHLSHFNGEF